MPSDVPPVTANREWMDRDNASPLRSGVRLQPNQNRRLMGVLLANNEKAVTHRRSGAIARNRLFAAPSRRIAGKRLGADP
ncbi:hypothetical protein JK364_23150 [Streptomyces sp. 110]|uniref:Uncharacterized protein n=1 Tax=Streptomyces endocoffeicus TaxID=2898945 RepID=A0ABS1PS80_9ACTN|nr:hypothetical protein [Streptomyces endocoffeicus]MBL1115272.1 hypothetical protein [Streptomyces endocoffeicus]